MLLYDLLLHQLTHSFILPPAPSLHRSSHSPLLIQFLYFFFAFVADSIADVIPEGGVELGVVTLSSVETFASVKPNRQHKLTGQCFNSRKVMPKCLVLINVP